MIAIYGDLHIDLIIVVLVPVHCSCRLRHLGRPLIRQVTLK